MKGHFLALYVLAFAALSIALGAAFGQRSDYLRLQAIGAPQVTILQILGRRHDP